MTVAILGGLVKLLIDDQQRLQREANDERQRELREATDARVRAEANEALDSGKLVQINLDGTRLPLPYSVLHFLDFTRWRGERQGTPWSEFDARVGGLLRGERAQGESTFAPTNHSVAPP